MKKLLLSALMISAALMSNAQDSSLPLGAGTLSLGGGLGVQIGGSSTKSTVTSPAGTISATNDGPSTFAFNILPNFQYFVADRFSVGLQLGLGIGSSVQKAVAPSTTETSSSTLTFAVSPYARYYFPLGEKAAFFGQGAVGISTSGGSTKSTTGGTSVSTDMPSVFGLGFGISPGIIFFPSNKIGIEAVIGNVFGLQMNSQTTKTGSGNTTSETVSSDVKVDLLNFNTLALQFGFNYYFGR